MRLPSIVDITHLHKIKSYSSEGNLISSSPRLSFNLIYNLEAVAALLKISMGLALVHFQKYWLLSKRKNVLLQSCLDSNACVTQQFQKVSFQTWLEIFPVAWSEKLIVSKSYSWSWLHAYNALVKFLVAMINI